MPIKEPKVYADQAGGIVFQLEQLAAHCRLVYGGKATLAEFEELYCLNDRALDGSRAYGEIE